MQVEDDDTSHQYIDSTMAFASSYNQFKAHNMLAIMFDLCFKNMKVI